LSRHFSKNDAACIMPITDQSYPRHREELRDVAIQSIISVALATII